MRGILSEGEISGEYPCLSFKQGMGKNSDWGMDLFPIFPPIAQFKFKYQFLKDTGFIPAMAMGNTVGIIPYLPPLGWLGVSEIISKRLFFLTLYTGAEELFSYYPAFNLYIGVKIPNNLRFSIIGEFQSSYFIEPMEENWEWRYWINIGIKMK